MATQSRYQDQGFKLYRKSDISKIPTISYSQLDGACYEDDGYDDTDALAVVKMLKDQIDQGQATLFREVNGWSRATGQQPISQETHDKWLNQETPEDNDGKRECYTGKIKPKVDVTRTVPKIIATPKPYIPPKPRKFMINEDCIEVEKWIAIIESVDNMEFIRTPESVKLIAKWIRQDEHANYRYLRPISCVQVREILEELKK